MIEAIPLAGLDPVQGASAPAQPKASSYEIRDFAAAMERTGNTQGPQAAAAPSVSEPGATSDGMKALLAGFDNINGGAENIRQLSTSLSANASDFSPGEVMQMTMRCQQFMFQCELTSNVANRTSDGIQQLFRQQS